MKSEHYQIEMLWKCKSGHADQLGRSLTCAICGSPKNEHQEYYMPGDISQNNKISGDLKPLADDGPNWSCKWCKSSERNSKGECHHCGGEKAAKKESDVKKEADSNSSYDTDDVDEKIPFKDSTGILLFKIAGVLGVFILVFLLVRWSDHKGTVQSVKISCDYDIEEKTAVVESGFDVPSDAFDQETLGERFHHNQRLVTGSHDVSYSVSVVCGQTCVPVPRVCTTTPQVCSNSCTSSKNGFANCTRSCSGGGQSCTGGGQSCSNRYCQETRHRQEEDVVWVPVNRTFFQWKRWVWKKTSEGHIPLQNCAEKCSDSGEEALRIRNSQVHQSVTVSESDGQKVYAVDSCVELLNGAEYKFSAAGTTAKDFKRE